MSDEKPILVSAAVCFTVLALCVAAAVGCSGDGSRASPGKLFDAGVTGSADGGDSAPALQEVPTAFLADAGAGWQTLVTARWTLAPDTETYRCVRFTLPEDVYIGSFRPLSPFGTHHALLMLADEASEPDGTTECDANTIARQGIGGSGVGSNDFVLPQGVAVQLRAGQQLLLNVHLFNATDRTLTGQSGTLIRLVDHADVQHVAESLLAGTLSLDIPAGQTTVQRGQCTMTQDSTLLAVAPHMHRLGVHLKAVAQSSLQGDVLLRDADYSFDSQLVYTLDQQVQMRAGDKVTVECTYDNTTDRRVNYGNSSLDEMCFAGLFRYPVGDDLFACVE